MYWRSVHRLIVRVRWTVIDGNYRFALSGVDLNRNWHAVRACAGALLLGLCFCTRRPELLLNTLQPTRERNAAIFLAKKLIYQISKTRCDISTCGDA